MDESERRVAPCPSPKEMKIIIGFAADQNIGRSTAAARFISKAVESMPEDVQQKYMRIYDSLSPEERRQPKKW